MKPILVLVLSVTTISAASASASVVTFASDADFITYQNSGAFTKTFGANVRWGSGTSAGDWEYAIVNGNDIPIGAVGQTPWTGTNAHEVTFTFDGVGDASLALSGIGSISRSVLPAPTTLFARVKDSETPFSQLSNIEIDLAYNGVGVDYSYSLLLGDSNAEYWGVVDSNMQFGFSITADAVLDGPRVAGSDPMYQFKVGVPEPSAAALLCLGGLVGLRRRR